MSDSKELIRKMQSNIRVLLGQVELLGRHNLEAELELEQLRAKVKEEEQPKKIAPNWERVEAAIRDVMNAYCVDNYLDTNDFSLARNIMADLIPTGEKL